MKLSIVGYKNHAIRLGKLLRGMGYENVFYFNHHSDSDSDIEDSDAFFICSPNETHMNWIDKLTGYGKYIFCEKPPVSNFEELRKIEDYRDKLYFNFNYRFSFLANLLDNYNKVNELGAPIYINCISTHGIAFKDSFQKNWRFNNNNLLSSIVGNLGIHYIDFLSYLFGRITSIDLKHLSMVSSELPDTCKITVNLENCFSDILLSYAAPFENKITVIYENGIVELSNGTVTVSGPRETYDENGLFTVPDSQVLKKSNNSKDYYDNSLVKSLEYFLSCAQGNNSLSKNMYEKSIQSNKVLFDLVNSK